MPTFPLEYLRAVHQKVQVAHIHTEMCLRLAQATGNKGIALPLEDFEQLKVLLSHCGSIIAQAMEESPALKAEVEGQYLDMIDKLRNGGSRG